MKSLVRLFKAAEKDSNDKRLPEKDSLKKNPAEKDSNDKRLPEKDSLKKNPAMKSLIRLFRAVEINFDGRRLPEKDSLKKTLGKGFVFSPEVYFNFSEDELENLAQIIEKDIGLTPEQLNSSFHKSWQKVKETDIEQLVLEQLAHYLTTYGFESVGIYDSNTVYIPDEKIEIPDYIGGIRVVVIRGYKKEQIRDKIMSLLDSEIALEKDTVKDVIAICKDMEIGKESPGAIKNKEVKTALLDHFKLVPEDPVEFLRYLVFKATGNTLLIKNAATIEEIKNCANKEEIQQLFFRYRDEFGLGRLAEVFLRFKPVFLAFRFDSLKPVINKIRRLSVSRHKTLPKDFLSEITSMIKSGISIDAMELKRNLEQVNNFRKIRLAYALKYRTKNVDAILYKIRNGTGFAKEFHFDKPEEAQRILDIVLESLTENVRKNVEGKSIYIPDNIHYALPATEKQFTGMFPSGTCMTVPKDMIVGINWHNVDGTRIDLDLSLINPTTGKMGWDGDYKTIGGSILFSGDMTDATGENGATELFYVERQLRQEFIVLVNYYNYKENIEVPFKIVLARDQPQNFEKNYMVDPNHVVSVANAKINSKQKVLGLLMTTPEECRFCFAETCVGLSVTSIDTAFVEHTRKYLLDFYRNTISLNRLLKNAGAELVSKSDDYDIDLSPENLEKDSIIKLLADQWTVQAP